MKVVFCGAVQEMMKEITHLEGEITKWKGKGKGDEKEEGKGKGKQYKLIYIWVLNHLNLQRVKI